MRQTGKHHLVGAVLVLASLVNVSPLWSQSLEHLWSQRFGQRLGDTGVDAGQGIAVDGADNILVTGLFQGTVDFGGGPLTSAGVSDIFVAKYDAAGAHLWSQRFGDTGFDQGNAIAVDGADDVLVTGYFGGTVDFGGGPLTSAGRGDIFRSDIFVAKFGLPVASGGTQKPGDMNQDGKFDVSDIIGLADHLFVKRIFPTLPCEGGTADTPGPGELFLLDHNGDGRLDVSDVVSAAGQQFGSCAQGAPCPKHAACLDDDCECIPIAGCQNVLINECVP